jgi:hypothetical protein
VRRIEELIGAPVALLSTSPERDDTILVTDPEVDSEHAEALPADVDETDALMAELESMVEKSPVVSEASPARSACTCCAAGSRARTGVATCL